MEKEIVVLSTSNVELDSIVNGDSEPSKTKYNQNTEQSKESQVNGIIENTNNNPITNGKNSSRHGSNGFNACKTEWVRLNIGENNFLKHINQQGRTVVKECANTLIKYNSIHLKKMFR